MNQSELNPHIDRFVCSRTGTEFRSRPRDRPLGLCTCCPPPGSPLLVRYKSLSLDRFPDKQRSASSGIWRFSPLLPVREPYTGYGAGVGLTESVLNQGLGQALDVQLWIKSEGSNPSGSFKDRGLSVAVALGCACGAKRYCLPTQGNAGIAAALFSSRLGLPPCIVYMPHDYVHSVYHRSAELFGAEVRFHGAHIAACGKQMRSDLSAELAAHEITDVSTFFEPGRLEGKKTLGFEIFESFSEDHLPDFIIYPTGGGTGLVGIWKAFEELRQFGLISGDAPLPRMVAVQSQQCAPVVRAFESRSQQVAPVESLGTLADGLNVPAAIMGHEILRVLGASQGTAVDVNEADIRDGFGRLGHAGVSCGLEGAATWAALCKLRERETIPAGSRVLLLNTSSHGVAISRCR